MCTQYASDFTACMSCTLQDTTAGNQKNLRKYDALLTGDGTRPDLAHGYTLTGRVNLSYKFQGRLGCGFICGQNHEASLCTLHNHMHQRTLLAVILALLLQLHDTACLQHKEAHKE